MKFLNIPVSVEHVPVLDPDFIPLGKYNTSFLQTANQDFHIALERAKGQIAVNKTKIHGTASMVAADRYYIRRLMKTMLWLYGGFRFHLCGSANIIDMMKEDFSETGCQAFDYDYMATVFENPFEILSCTEIPEEKGSPKAMGRHLEGCRIGFDAGGSDRKVSAVIDGEAVFSEEVVWFPKTNADPDYHYQGIVQAFQSAASKMPRVDAVGISSAGVYIENRTMSASLFLQVGKEDFEAKVKDIYTRAVEDTFGKNTPYEVVNDGDVSALAGAMNLGCDNVLGIAMGTSEAVGFVDKNGCITGWLNELAFVPVDASPTAMEDEWSHDIGCGVKYFSQDAVIKLAPAAGIHLDPSLSPAEKLKVVQKAMETPGSSAEDIFRSIGVYLGHTLAFYHGFYGFAQVLLLGRVMSGRGGDILLETAQKVLAEEYPEVAKSCAISLPDEKARRVGQSVAAASLPEVPKS